MALDMRHELLQIWTAALGAVDPLRAVPGHLAARPAGRLIVLGAGKASARMALAVEEFYGPPLEGLILTRYGHGVPSRFLKIVEADHPLPDTAGRDVAAQMLALAEGLRDGDRLLCLISGGGSALLSLPVEGITFADKQTVSRALLRSGAPIDAMNAVRKHLSRIKGGRLAAAAFPAETVTLAVSDVPGDDPSVIASGPTVADPSTLADARAILARYGIDPPARVRQALEDPAHESVKPGDPRLARSTFRLVARPAHMIDTAAAAARALGYEILSLGDRIEGEARVVGAAHAQLALKLANDNRAVAIISGGELTVTGASGADSGGRSREYALSLALGLTGGDNIAALAGDSDGIDGTEDAAGAFVLPDTSRRATQNGLNPQTMLETHRSGAFFSTLNDALVTGPTGTNVGDLRIILIRPRTERAT